MGYDFSFSFFLNIYFINEGIVADDTLLSILLSPVFLAMYIRMRDQVVMI